MSANTVHTISLVVAGIVALLCIIGYMHSTSWYGTSGRWATGIFAALVFYQLSNVVLFGGKFLGMW